MYDRVGGMPFFQRLVEVFYRGVAGDDVLARLYPENPDFTGARHRLTLFLGQYWGGPATYAQERGHPRLRMRHAPFTIGELERDRWLMHMSHAVHHVVESLEAEPEERRAVAADLLGYFRPTAEHMRNNTGLPITSARFVKG